MKKKNLRFWIVAALALAALAGLVLWGWRAGWLALFTDPERLQATVARTGPWAPLVFFLLQVAQVLAAPIPGNVTTLVGGALFGFGKSFFISTLAITAGSCIAFLLARKFGMALVRRFVSSEAIDKYMGLMRGRSTLLLAIMFLVPFFPDDMLCFLAGLSPIRFPGFVVLTLLTRPWGLLGSSLVGSGSLQLPWWAWALLIVACAAVMLASFKYGPAIEDKLVQWLKRFEKNKNTQK